MLQALSADFAQVMPQVTQQGFFTSLATLQQPSVSLTPDGAPDNTFVSVSGLINIPCMDAVLAPGNIEATEAKELEQILSRSYRHIVLNGFYSQLLPNSSVGPVVGATVAVPGSGYKIGDTGTILDGDGNAVYTVTALLGPPHPTGLVSAVRVAPAGSGYTGGATDLTQVNTGSGDGTLELLISVFGNPGAPAGWRVIVDGIAYDLLGAEPDSQNTQTRLKCQLVTL